MTLWRTLLFVPADQPHMLVKASSLGADALVIDLEDAIEPTQKAAARLTLREHLETGALSGARRLCVRINPLHAGGHEDIRALAGAPIDLIVLPKCESAEDVHRARSAIDAWFTAPAAVGIAALIESPTGVLEVATILAAGVDAVAFGGEDFSVALGVSRSADSVELMFPRAWIGIHAARAGVPAIDTVYTDLADYEGLERESTRARQLGFAGKLLIHPAQVEPVRRIFSPTAEQVAWARKVVAAATDGRDEGSAVVVVDGRMIDPPVVAQAEAILARGATADE